MTSRAMRLVTMLLMAVGLVVGAGFVTGCHGVPHSLTPTTTTSPPPPPPDPHTTVIDCSDPAQTVILEFEDPGNPIGNIVCS